MTDLSHLETTTLPPEAGTPTLRQAREGAPQRSLVISHLESTRVMRLAEGWAARR